MSELKLLYKSLNFTNVQTYIQSGNIVFCSLENNSQKVKKLIEQKIEEEYDYRVPVFIISSQKLKSVIERSPLNDAEIDLAKYAVAFLDSVPNKFLLKYLDKFKSTNENLFFLEDVIYLYCPNGFGKTKLTNNLIENNLKVTATTRNWRTINKLFEMINEVDCGSKSK